MLTPTKVRFGAAPAAQPRFLLGDANVHLTVDSDRSVLGRFDAVLDVDERVAAVSEAHDFVLSLRPQELVLTFTDLNVTVARGGVLGLTLRMNPLLDANLSGAPELPVTTLQVRILYDSTAHPGTLPARSKTLIAKARKAAAIL